MTHTNAHALLTVGLRVVSAYYLVYTMATVITGFFIVDREFVDQQKMVWAMQTIACVLYAAVWMFADKLAGFGLASRNAPIFESSIEPTMWLRIGIVLIGIWVAADSLGTLVHLAAYKWMLNHSDLPMEMRKFDAQSTASVISSITEVLIGLWMALGARGFTELVERARFAGPASRNIAPDEPPAP